jgi:hypothetical protein
MAANSPAYNGRLPYYKLWEIKYDEAYILLKMFLNSTYTRVCSHCTRNLLYSFAMATHSLV